MFNINWTMNVSASSSIVLISPDHSDQSRICWWDKSSQHPGPPAPGLGKYFSSDVDPPTCSVWLSFLCLESQQLQSHYNVSSVVSHPFISGYETATDKNCWHILSSLSSLGIVRMEPGLLKSNYCVCFTLVLGDHGWEMLTVWTPELDWMVGTQLSQHWTLQ